MAGRLPPSELQEAIQEHLRLAHGIEKVDPREIGRSHSRRRTVTLTWDPGTDDERGPSFRCRRCQPGFDRHYSEIFAAVPPPRTLDAIQRHFALYHPGVTASLTEIAYEGNRPEEERALYLPATPEIGARIICRHCPDGLNQITVREPLYGDARRLTALLRAQPALWGETRNLAAEDQAAYLEAWDRGLLQEQRQQQAQTALAELRAARRDREPGPLAGALRAMLRERVEAGEGITRVISEIAELARKDPISFTRLVGAHIPGLGDLAGGADPEQFLQAVRQFLLLPEGSCPTVSQRYLWEIWGRA